MPWSSRQFWNRRASLPPPASGETTVTWCCASRSCEITLARSGTAVRWSTGKSKNPWIWPVCRSMVTTRSAPATVSMSATSRAVMGSRPSAFRSWREYP